MYNYDTYIGMFIYPCPVHHYFLYTLCINVTAYAVESPIKRDFEMVFMGINQCSARARVVARKNSVEVADGTKLAAFKIWFIAWLCLGTTQLSNEKHPGCLGYLGGCTTQLYRDYNKPISGSQWTNQYNMGSQIWSCIVFQSFTWVNKSFRGAEESGIS